MRIVYGASAVAALSVMTVGLIPPQDAATVDQPIADQPIADQPIAADPTAEPQRGTARVDIRHVTRYIQLKPGQTAPPGATVISAAAPTPRVVVTHNSVPGPVSQPAARPNQQPAPKPAPKPKTHQSGR